jgi:uncharacterized protein
MMYRPGFEWDDRKRRATLAAHGRPDFMVAIRIFDGPVLEALDGRKDYREERRRAIGEVDGRCLVVVYTPRGGNRRIISARKANRKEAASFRQATAAARSD